MLFPPLALFPLAIIGESSSRQMKLLSGARGDFVEYHTNPKTSLFRFNEIVRQPGAARGFVWLSRASCSGRSGIAGCTLCIYHTLGVIKNHENIPLISLCGELYGISGIVFRFLMTPMSAGVRATRVPPVAGGVQGLADSFGPPFVFFVFLAGVK